MAHIITFVNLIYPVLLVILDSAALEKHYKVANDKKHLGRCQFKSSPKSKGQKSRKRGS